MSHVPADLYHDPLFVSSFNSMEGVPDWPEPAESPGEKAARGTFRTQLHANFGALGTFAPGVVLAASLAAIGAWGAQELGRSVLGFTHSPVSAIMVALLLGLALRNTIGLPAVYESGLRFCLRFVLRMGIMLLGLRLSLAAVGQIGLTGLPIVLGSIIAALVIVAWINRALGLPRRLGSLIAVGTSICGVSAIVATGPVVDAEDDEVSYAVACVTLFGMLALFVYPFLAHGLFGGEARLAGLFLGTAIHDTAQVAGAGLMYRQQFGTPEALDTAAVIKLVRNVNMAWVIPLMAFLHRRNGEAGARGARPSWHQVVPPFVLGFIGLAALRSLGDLGSRPLLVFDHAGWERLLATADLASGWCLTTAMAGVGLGTALAKLRVLGWRPLCVGLAAAVLVGGVSWTLIRMLVAHS